VEDVRWLRAVRKEGSRRLKKWDVRTATAVWLRFTFTGTDEHLGVSELHHQEHYIDGRLFEALSRVFRFLSLRVMDYCFQQWLPASKEREMAAMDLPTWTQQLATV
jgi:hypothetical protein